MIKQQCAGLYVAPPPRARATAAAHGAQWSLAEFLFFGGVRSLSIKPGCVCACVPASGVALSTTAVCRRRKSCTVYAKWNSDLARCNRFQPAQLLLKCSKFGLGSGLADGPAGKLQLGGSVRTILSPALVKLAAVDWRWLQ